MIPYPFLPLSANLHLYYEFSIIPLVVWWLLYQLQLLHLFNGVEEMAVESQPIRAAMQLAYEAKLYDLQQDFNKALKLYEASIEKLFPLVEG